MTPGWWVAIFLIFDLALLVGILWWDYNTPVRELRQDLAKEWPEHFS